MPSETQVKGSSVAASPPALKNCVRRQIGSKRLSALWERRHRRERRERITNLATSALPCFPYPTTGVCLPYFSLLSTDRQPSEVVFRNHAGRALDRSRR